MHERLFQLFICLFTGYFQSGGSVVSLHQFGKYQVTVRFLLILKTS